jgi:hypothetical protein
MNEKQLNLLIDYIHTAISHNFSGTHQGKEKLERIKQDLICTICEEPDCIISMDDSCARSRKEAMKEAE